MDDIQTLIRQRGTQKGQLTRMQTFIQGFDCEQGNLEEIHARLPHLETVWERIQDVQQRIDILVTDSSQEQAIAEIEQLYFSLKSTMNSIIKARECKPVTEGNGIATLPHSQLKLPTVQLPTFEGNYKQWLAYEDTFNSLIHKNKDIPPIQKFQYLRTSLKGEALRLIENLQISEANYKVAWDLLLDRYSNKRLIASSYIDEILHIKPVQRENATELREFVNTASSNLNALQAMQNDASLEDMILTQHLVSHVDHTTRKAWELNCTESTFPSLKDFLTFLEKRCQALESMKPSSTALSENKQSYKKPHFQPKQDKVTRAYVTTSSNACLFCKEVHALYTCRDFIAANEGQRLQFLKKNNICTNCLRQGHVSRACKSSSCRKCGLRHNTLLHVDRLDKGHSRFMQGDETQIKEVSTTNPHQDIQNTASPHASYCAVKARPHSQVLLATALVKVQDHTGKWLTCRALMDSASQSNFIRESLVQKLRLAKQRRVVPIKGINDATSETRSTVEVRLQSTVYDFSTSIECAVLPSITGKLPTERIHYGEWNVPSDIPLADPTFHIPGEIDLLLGAELFFQVLRPDSMTNTENHPTLQKTELGWILAGRIPEESKTNQHITTCFTMTDDNLNKQLRAFWELEELGKCIQTREEIACEQHFVHHTRRDHTGRFIARLPLKEPRESLGQSYEQAAIRLRQLETKLQRQPELREDYNQFMHEYELLGHMKQIDVDDKIEASRKVSYYMPHHAVLKPSNSTTKVRVVFNASAKTSNGKSLNDILMVGPTVQSDLMSIVLRFRTHPVAFTSDLEKFYRQINVHQDDTPLQRILWRSTPSEPIKIYELQTLTYGTAPASYIATRCLQQLATAESGRYPQAAKILAESFYVDNLASGAQNLKVAQQLQTDLIDLLSRGGFVLRKWCSNNQQLMQSIPPEYREQQFPVQLHRTQGINTLGISWNPIEDEFIITCKYMENPDVIVTKRQVTSIISSIFDPLGIISPIIIKYKMLLQCLWQNEVSWDQQLSPDLLNEWRKLQAQLPLIKNVKVKRFVLQEGTITEIQIHGFADASEKGYGACLYVRSTNEEGHISVELLCSKSRVSPIRKVSLPRLELCAALLLSELVHKTIPALQLPIDNTYLWTDSTIVLSWISASPAKWKTFVANRVSRIQEITNISNWKHVSSCDNPADLISRGTDVNQLQQCSLWWNGPEWLKLDPSIWPNLPISVKSEMPERRNIATLSLVNQTPERNLIHKFSNLSRLIRVMAYCQRFIKNLRNPHDKDIGQLTAQDLQRSLNTLIRFEQYASYSTEIQSLKSKQEVSHKSTLRGLYPFLDDQQLLRVGGRLRNSDLPTYDSKHQIILPPTAHLTKLIIEAEHRRLLHAGPQLLINSLREKYWIPRSKQIIKRILHKCIICFKLNARASSQLMGELPTARVRPSRPFENVAVDYAGPIYVKTGTIRSKTVIKCYVAVFICLSTKAIHLEAVSNLTTEAFIATLRRFISRRGKASHLYSDNGTNFVGANKELHELQQLFRSEMFSRDLQDYVAMEGMQWHFMPPGSPHFSGLAEAAVKSMKYHLTRSVANI